MFTEEDWVYCLNSEGPRFVLTVKGSVLTVKDGLLC